MTEQEKQEFKENITFHDLENNLISLKIEIRDNGVLSISGDMGNSGGQILDNIKPLNEEQKRIIEIWRKYHLNDFHAGTKKQENALKEWRGKKNIDGYDYNKEVKYLKSIRLYSDKGYKYGTSWLKRELPHQLESELKSLCERINRQERERKERFKIKSFSDVNITDNKIIALAINLNLEPKEAEEDIKDEGNNIYNYCGIDYFIGTEEETKDECMTYLTDDEYLWRQSVEAKQTTYGLEEWAEWVINSDGYGSILNHYDGSEEQEEVNGIWYYIIRR